MIFPPRVSSTQLMRFSFHCALAPMLALVDYDPKADEINELTNKMISVWRKVADYIIEGDYYPPDAI